MRILICIFLLLGVTSFAQKKDDNKDEEEKVYIENSVQVLDFYVDKKKKILEARLSVNNNFISQTERSINVQRVVFFDETSSIERIRRNKKKKLPRYVSDYEQDGIFHSDLKLCLYSYDLDGMGEELMLGHEKIFHDVLYLEPLYFQDFYTTDKSTIIIKKPEWLEIDIVEWNFDKITPTKNEVTKDGVTTYTYTLTDVINTSEYSNVPNQSKIFPHVIVIPKSYNYKGTEKHLMGGTADLYKWYAGLVDDIGNEPSVLNSIVEELMVGKESDEDKLKAIYYWVQDNIKYIAFEEGIMGFRPEDCQSVYNNKYGDCKGMANLAKEMFLIAGFDARLTWIGTNSLPYDYSLPSLIVDNHMICTVMLGDERIFIDPTEKYSDLYHYAHRIQGKQVLIENGASYIIEKIPEDYDNHQETYSTHLRIEGEQLIGKGKASYEGERVVSMRNRLSSRAEKDRLDYVRGYISNGDKNIDITLLDVPDLLARDNDLILDYDIVLDHHIVSLDKEIYINPEIDFQLNNIEIAEDREVPYAFSRLMDFAYEMKIEIPEGWKVNYLPEAIESIGEKYSYALSFNVEGNTIKYNKTIKINNKMLLQNEFADWNIKNKKLSEFYEDQIILEKI